MPLTFRSISTWFMGGFFIIAGTYHLINPTPYLAMMPPYLPWPAALVIISGVAEIVGGIGLCIARLRLPAAWGLIALLVAVFPANLQVAMHGWPGLDLPRWILWLRLPFQPFLIWLIYRCGIARPSSASARPIRG
jgi:uncharacterized membrane protein